MYEAKRSFMVTFDRPFELEHPEEVWCNLCSSKRFTVFDREQLFEVRECSDCGLAYISPQPSDEDMTKICEGMYPDDSEEEVQARSLGLHEKLIRRILERRRPEGGRLLDVGCGYGLFLESIAGLPWELTGIEPSRTAANYARKLVSKADIRIGTVDEAEIEPASQDCITCIAVLDHLKDPRGAMDRFAEWLAPDGLLVVQVAYTMPFLRLKRWAPWIPLYFGAPHLMFDIPPRRLERYWRELGFDDIRYDVPPPYASPSRLKTAAIWPGKVAGRVVRTVSTGKCVFPFIGSYVLHGKKTSMQGASAPGTRGD